MIIYYWIDIKCNLFIFFRRLDNFDDLARHYDRIIAVDWLGMGCSSRTSKRVTQLSIIESMKNCGESSLETFQKEIAEKVTDEFIDSLEELRKEENIENFVLAGHSLGGYLVGKYTLKYPEQVRGLILISPAGVPELPPKSDRIDSKDLDWRIRFMKKLWNLNITPQSLIRIVGPSRGIEWIEKGIGRRFSHRWQGEELKLFSDYFYHITAAPGNGEYALNALLDPIFVKKSANRGNRSPIASAKDPKDTQQSNSKSTNNIAEGADDEEEELSETKNEYRSGVFARNPLENDLIKLNQSNIPILMIFGDHDWLYYPSAPKSIDLWKANGINAELAILSNAGHHLYLENAPDFNNLVVNWTKKIKYE